MSGKRLVAVVTYLVLDDNGSGDFDRTAPSVARRMVAEHMPTGDFTYRWPGKDLTVTGRVRGLEDLQGAMRSAVVLPGRAIVRNTPDGDATWPREGP